MRKPNKRTNPEGKSGSTSRSGGKRLTTYGIGALPIVNHFLDRAQVAKHLREVLKDDKRCKIPPSTGILVLIRNYLVSRQPIYGVQEWAQELQPSLLGLTNGQVLSLNDDRVGRCLDRLFEADCPALILALTRHVVEEFGLDLSEFHNDTTTITFFGTYVEPTVENLLTGKWKPIINYGHNKDHRPDLKQLLYNLTVSHDGTVPVAFGVEAGNVTDDQLHKKNWDLLLEIVGGPDFLYVADSKLATKENLSHIANRGGRFVSVLPRSRKEDRDFRRRVVRGDVRWAEVARKVDEQGAVKDVTSSVDGLESSTSEGYRLLWFHSTRKAELDVTARGKSVRRAVESLDELEAKLQSPRTRYRDESRVRNEVERRLANCGAKDWINFAIHEEEEEKYIQKTRGRPGAETEYRREVKSRFHIVYDLDHEKLDEAIRHDGVFPLVTNDRTMTAKGVLESYKRQASIEKRFSQLKTQFQITPVFLKSTQRIVALLTVYYFAMLIQALVERELRQSMRRDGIEWLPLYPEGRKCCAPTTRRILDLFKNIERHELTTPQAKSPSVFVTDLTGLQEVVLDLLGVSEEHYRP